MRTEDWLLNSALRVNREKIAHKSIEIFIHCMILCENNCRATRDKRKRKQI